jgi:hypothetical protein
MKLLPFSFGLGKQLLACGAGFLCLMAVSQKSDAQPSFTYTISGSADDWTLDFTVVDPVTGGRNISTLTLINFLEGSGYSASGSPAGFTPSVTGDVAWTGGPITPGTTLSGFDVLDTADSVAPTTEALRYDGQSYDPITAVATGTSSPKSAPDGGSTLLLLGMGVTALNAIRRRCSRH